MTLQRHKKSTRALPPALRTKVSTPMSSNIPDEDKDTHLSRTRIYILEHPSSATAPAPRRRPLAHNPDVRCDRDHPKSCATKGGGKHSSREGHESTKAKGGTLTIRTDPPTARHGLPGPHGPRRPPTTRQYRRETSE